MSPSLINQGVFTNKYFLNLMDNCAFTNSSGAKFYNYGATYVGKMVGTSISAGLLFNQGEVVKLLVDHHPELPAA